MLTTVVVGYCGTAASQKVKTSRETGAGDTHGLLTKQ